VIRGRTAFSLQENVFVMCNDIQHVCHYLQHTVRSQDEKGEIMKRIAIALATLTLITTSAFAGNAPKKDIVDTAVAAGSFGTLAKALQAADLVQTLKGKGPFTVFAPTDAAFAKLPAGTLENLLKPENKAKLQAILTYHVVPGSVSAAQVVKMDSAKTVNGQSVSIRVAHGVVTVDGAQVVQPDIAASNGVIHVIDSVILPK
jgi:uncharacterized surface protein with fasciclin (FAS1) repeats